MKALWKHLRKESGLQWRMTLWVVGTVTVVATLIMSVSSMLLHQEYEKEVRRQLVGDMDTTARIIGQRMVRVEYIAKTAASIVGEITDRPQAHPIETILADLLSDTECVNAVTLALAADDDSTAVMYSAYRKYFSNEGECVAVPPVTTSLADDLNWRKSYGEGEEFWCVPFTPQDFPQAKLQCYSVPIYSADGRCRGMFCTMVLEEWIEDIVKEYKVRPDIDVSIYSSKGVQVVSPSDEIACLPEEDRIVEDSTLDRLGWRLVFTADRHVMSEKLSPLIWHMVTLIVVLLFSMVLAIALTVRFVARPYVQREKRNSEAKAAMERELKIAADTQRQLVPHRFPPFPERKEVSIDACLHPALQVGGDLYDFFLQGDALYFCIGDVSGKGAPAALLMAATHYLFRSVAATMPIAEAVRLMNLSLCTNNEQCNFVTFFFGQLDLKSGSMEYCNAGHNPPILIHEGKAKYFAPSESMPLGAWEQVTYISHCIQLDKGDTVLLYTDGVTEAMNAQNEALGEEKTLKCVADCESKEPRCLIECLMQCIGQHAGDTPQSDDITMLGIRRNM